MQQAPLKDQAALRKSILERRRAQDPKDRALASVAIVDRLKEAWKRESLPSGLSIGLYRPMPEEADAALAGEWLESTGSRLWFPRILSFSECTMEWASAPLGEPRRWKPGRYGILEPRDSIRGEARPPIDVIFVPGVAFGEEGQRVGMGKGFYDRTLGGYPDALRIALAYDFQILSSVPENPWDARVDWIFSEHREIQTCRVRERIGQLIR